MNFAEYGLDDVRESVTEGGVRVTSASVREHDEGAVWRALRQAHPQTGLWPVLTSKAHTAAADTYGWPQPQGPDGLARALAVDPAHQMEVLIAAVFENHVEDCGADEDEARAVWREWLDVDWLASRLDPVTTPPPGIHRIRAGEVLLVPAAAGYEVPVLVPGVLMPANWFGGPSHPILTAADHLAVLRLWERRHAAQLYFASGSRLELAVGNPPREPVELARCAIEQSAYCEDLRQILGEQEVVARRQAPADHWSFWWD